MKHSKFISYTFTIIVAISFGFINIYSAGNEEKNMYADTNSSFYQQGLDGAKWYMDLQKNDEYWIGKKPKLENFGVLYYSESEESPSYIEYKIKCNEDDCGGVMVNLDSLDVLVPEGSTFGKTNYENLSVTIDANNLRFYRFGLTNQYITGVDKNGSEKIGSLNPNEGNIKNIDIIKFKKQKRQKSDSNEDLLKVSGIAPMAATTGTNTYVAGASTTNCPSRTPCYGQFTDTYSGINCTVGCSPNAMAIIYGYYDRQGLFPNLVSGTATDISYVKNAAGTVIHALDTNIKTMSNSIRSSMSTICIGGGGATNQTNVQNGKQYAISKGYSKTTSYYNSTNINPTVILQALRVEINAGRPMIIHSNGVNSGHSFVAYGYSSDTTSTMVRVNYGGTYLGDKTYFGKDINLAQAVPASAGGGQFNAYTTLKIAQ